jgi:tRNA dimethylallyltransferase
LSLNLSDEGNYEIISCDSMQIYRGADIMTAKATKAE